MSDAILTFQVQLSAVMETVLKSAMYEITRLVEDSFLEEVARSKQEVEALRQRLQWSESRRRERESGGRARCLDCGRVGVSSEESEDPPSGTLSGVEEGRGLKQEKALEGSWSSCSVGGSNPGPLSALEEEATPSPVRELDTSSTAPSDLDRDRPDSLLKEEVEELQDITGGDDIQGTWLPCAEGEGLLGAEADPPPPLSKGCAEPEWSPAVGQDTAPSSGSLLPERQSSRPRGGEACGAYESEAGQEAAARRLSLAGPQRCGPRRSDPDSQRVTWTTFKLGDSHAEAEGLDPPYAAAAEPASPQAHRDPQPRPAEEGAGNSASPLQYLNVKSEALLIKEEAEVQPVCSEELRWDVAHRESWDRGDLQVEHTAHSPPPQGAVTSLQCFPEKLESLALRFPPQQQGAGETSSEVDLRQISAQVHLEAVDRSRGASWDCDSLMVSKNIQGRQRGFTGDKAFSCVECGKSFTQLKNLQAHLKYHAGERPHRCSQCGKSFLYQSRLKVHLLSHTGERPFSCTYCEKSFLSFYDLKVHQRNHTGEKPYRCSQCGKGFTRLSILKEHGIIHSKEKSFGCTLCGKRFTRPSNLKAHLRRHVVEKQHSCTLCGKSFLYLCRLKKHLKKFHWTDTTTSM